MEGYSYGYRLLLLLCIPDYDFVTFSYLPGLEKFSSQCNVDLSSMYVGRLDYRSIYKLQREKEIPVVQLGFSGGSFSL